MLADLLPVLVLAGIALVIPLGMLVAAKKRQEYCGQRLKHCFWCGEPCTYYKLENPPDKVQR
jgi:hypothetical protein